MAEQQTETEAQGAEATTTEGGFSILEQAVSATKQTEPDQAKELIANLAKQAMEGTVTWDKNLTATITKAIAEIDSAISSQLAEVMHHEKFQKLEGSWRGLHHLVKNTETGSGMKIRVLNASKKEIAKDLSKAIEFDQSQLFKTIYENEFGTAGGEPYGLMIGDYEFNNTPPDMEMLSNISHIAAAGFAPFISAAGPGMLGLETYEDLAKPRDLEKVFQSAEYTKWRGFRDSEDARFVSLCMPRTLARVPYGESTNPIEAFRYEEFPLDAEGRNVEAEHDKFCWMNAAYVMGTVMTRSFAENGWCTSIRGAEGGGKVEDLPTFSFQSEDGDVDLKCPTEVQIADRREAELSNLGFLPLCHYKNTDYAVFFGGQTAQKPKKYDRPDATANAAISARLPYIMATSRIAHYLKVMARDKVGSFLEAKDAEIMLNRWISKFVNSSEGATADAKAKFPLREATVEVAEIEGAPGSYNAVAYLRPWLQMEELTTSLRMVASIPSAGG
ncbi:MAG: type VI secretion system protein ImpC [Halieaceae bacterium]|jgi:type VI secretion system protein ImpC